MKKNKKQSNLDEFMEKSGIKKEIEKIPSLKDKQDLIEGAKNILERSEGNVDKAIESWKDMVRQVMNTPHPPK